MRIVFTAVLACLLAVTGCAKGSGAGSGPFGTPEASFEQLRKALMNRDADYTWECLGPSWRDIFDTGRKELMAKPAEEKEKIAREGMVSVKDIDAMTAKNFFAFYFNLQKRDVYQTNAPEIIMQKAEALSKAAITEVVYKDAAKTVASLRYTLDGNAYTLPMKKVDDRWLLDARKEEGQFQPK
jgi:hypothetical protein